MESIKTFSQPDFFMKGPISCLEFFSEQFLLAGQGSRLQIYNLISKLKVFEQSVFHQAQKITQI